MAGNPDEKQTVPPTAARENHSLGPLAWIKPNSPRGLLQIRLSSNLVPTQYHLIVNHKKTLQETCWGKKPLGLAGISLRMLSKPPAQIPTTSWRHTPPSFEVRSFFREPLGQMRLGRQ